MNAIVAIISALTIGFAAGADDCDEWLAGVRAARRIDREWSKYLGVDGALGGQSLTILSELVTYPDLIDEWALLGDAAGRLRFTKSELHEVLRLLEREGFIARAGTGHWRLRPGGRARLDAFARAVRR